MKITRKQLRKIIAESLNEEKKSYPPLKLSDFKNIGDNNKDITMEDIRSARKSDAKGESAIDMVMANDVPGMKATGRFFVVGPRGPIGSPGGKLDLDAVMKDAQKKYNFEPVSAPRVRADESKYSSLLLEAFIDGKRYLVVIERVGTQS